MTETTENNNSKNIRKTIYPRHTGLRFLVVMGTIITLYLIVILLLWVVKKLGMDPRDFDGLRFVITFATLSVLAIFHGLHALFVFMAQRFIHRQPFKNLGFKAPLLRHLLIGFALGIVIKSIDQLAVFLAASKVNMNWSVPSGTPFFTIIAYYFFFFFIFLTANSFSEELVFRCYPIEQFRNSSKIMMVAAAVSGSLVFTAIHFIIGSFDLAWLARLIGFSIITIYLYIHWKSIWLIIGFHNAINVIAFSFSGHWKMGGLFRLNWTPPSPVVHAALELMVFLIALWLIHLYRIRQQRSKSMS